jgi:L-fucose mutarotase/ribose pyranase (RbsD/FucU family)
MGNFPMVNLSSRELDRIYKSLDTITEKLEDLSLQTKMTMNKAESCQTKENCAVNHAKFYKESKKSKAIVWAAFIAAAGTVIVSVVQAYVL